MTQQEATETQAPPVQGGQAQAASVPTSDERTMAMLAHLLGIVTGFIGALVIWLIKKDQSKFVNEQGKEALNWQITMVIGWIIAGVTTFILIGALLYPVLGVLNLIFCLMGGLKANKGESYRYPFALRLIK